MNLPMHAPASPVIHVNLQAGQCCVGGASHRMRTVLGSCVSITLWHPRRRVGAMSHFLLPSRRGPIKRLDGHYGEEALWLMLRGLARFGVNPQECQAKIFGGGNMFPQQTRSAAETVGEKNGALARSLLSAYRLPLVCENLFGIGHRQLHFDVSNGDVWVRQIVPAEIAPDLKERT
jgi:chemotaxis protein CheD